MPPEETELYEQWGVPPPTHDEHGEDSPDNPISSKLKSLNPRNWRQRGNLLVADTDVGEFAQTIPPDYLLVKTDENNLPKFKKVEYEIRKETSTTS